MAVYKTAYIVTTNNGNEFIVKQKDHLGEIIIDTFNCYSDMPANANREDFITLQDLHIALLALGTSREVLLPVFISVLLMIGLDVYSVDEKVQS